MLAFDQFNDKPDGVSKSDSSKEIKDSACAAEAARNYLDLSKWAALGSDQPQWGPEPCGDGAAVKYSGKSSESAIKFEGGARMMIDARSAPDHLFG